MIVSKTRTKVDKSQMYITKVNFLYKGENKNYLELKMNIQLAPPSWGVHTGPVMKNIACTVKILKTVVKGSLSCAFQ